MHIAELTALARQMQASDIHISEGLPLAFRIHGRLEPAPVQPSAAETRALILGLLDDAGREKLAQGIDSDFALATPDGLRQRVNVFCQQGKAAATLRLLNDSIPTLAQLGLPPVLEKLAEEPRGLILVTGPTGSGKSTTLAAMIDHINATRPDHILTIEDPIEYVYTGKQSIIHQREVGRDVPSFAAALRRHRNSGGHRRGGQPHPGGQVLSGGHRHAVRRGDGHAHPQRRFVPAGDDRPHHCRGRFALLPQQERPETVFVKQKFRRPAGRRFRFSVQSREYRSRV